MDLDQFTGAGVISARGSEGPPSSFYFLGGLLAALFAPMVTSEELWVKSKSRLRSWLLDWFSTHLDEFWMRKHELVRWCTKDRKIYLGDWSSGGVFFLQMRRARCEVLGARETKVEDEVAAPGGECQ